MGRQRKKVEVPGQETAGTETTNIETEGQLLNSTSVNQTDAENRITATEIQTLNAAGALAERNTLLGTINEQGAAIIARFETQGYTDLADQQLTDNLEFLQLVKKATNVVTGGTGPMVTNEEGKKQPAVGKPVLTEHGWHVPG